MEQIYNYLDMSMEQRKIALNSLSLLGFCPAYGKVKTMQNIMDKSIAGQMPQFYFAFRDTKLIGYMFLIGDEKKFRAFPWRAVDNLNELSMQFVEPLMEIAIKAWSDAGNNRMADYCKRLLNDYRKGIGWRGEIKTSLGENE